MSMLLVPPTAAASWFERGFPFCLLFIFALDPPVIFICLLYLASCPYERRLVAWVDDEPALLVSYLSDESSPGVGHS